MRGLLAFSIGAACAAALALPPALPTRVATVPAASAEQATGPSSAAAGDTSAAPAAPAALAGGTSGAVPGRTAAARTGGTAGASSGAAAADALPASSAGALGAPAAAAMGDPAAAVPGDTRSVPLVPLTADRASGSAAVQGLPRREVRHFSLVGVVWDDPRAELHGSVRVRVRDATTERWSGWQDVGTHNHEHAPDPDTGEGAARTVRGATAPLWVGDSDGVEVRVRAAEPAHTDGSGRAARTGSGAPALPSGLRLELVDPGRTGRVPAGPRAHGAVPLDARRAAVLSPEAAAAWAANAGLAPPGALEIPAQSRGDAEDNEEGAASQGAPAAQAGPKKIGPRPRIVTRHGWGADESLREKKFLYTKQVKAGFVHHTVTGNNYTCAQAPSVIRAIYRYHVRSMGWRDIGYNFLVDKCGTIYEGRAGGVAKPVMGAHTRGFNSYSTGIAVLGTFTSAKPSGDAVTAVARLTAWKLGLDGMNPAGKTYLTSGGGNLYQKGKNVRLSVISGHRDTFATQCPGGHLYGRLGSVRSDAARYQGR